MYSKFLEKKKYHHYLGLDLLRGVSGYGVAISHYYAFIYKNQFSEYISFIFVEFFFVLSGFVLFPQLLKIFRNKKNLLIFYKRRWLRTIPLYFIFLIAISLLFKKLFSFDFFKYSFFLQDVIPNFLNLNYFPIVWSLSIEEFFYLFFPIFLLIVGKNNLLKKCAYLFIFLVLMKIIFLNFFDLDFLRKGTFLRLDAILLGFLIRFFYLRVNFYFIFLLSIILISAYVGLYDYFFLNINNFFIKFFFIIFLQFFSGVILLLFLKIEFFNKFMIIKKISNYVSNQSYSIYLSHMIFIYLLIDLNIYTVIKFIIYLFLLIVTSAFSYYYIEKPILKTRPRYFT